MRRGRRLLFAIVLPTLLAACDEPPPATTAPPTSAGPACPAASVDVPATGGFPSSSVIERRVRELVARDFDRDACLVRVVARRDSMRIEASHEGETVRAVLASSMGSPSESLAPHVAARRLLGTLLDAHVEGALSNGRGVALVFSDHAAICYRAAAADASCVRTTAVLGFESVTEPSRGTLLVRALEAPDAARGTEWELSVADTTTLTTRSAPLQPGRSLGTPPPDPDRFARVRSASSEGAAAVREPAAEGVAEAMPPGATTVRLDARSAGTARLFLLSRCEGLLAHCVSIVARREGSTLRVAPSFATDPARIDAVEDASALAPGALRVRVLEEGFHEASASELYVVPADEQLAAHQVVLGTETERGEGETITEGCYRTPTIEAPGRVRLADARGWSGTHSEARGWNVVPSRTCAPEEVQCLEPASGFGPCP